MKVRCDVRDRRPSEQPFVVVASAVMLGSLVLGGLTSVGQSVLPEALAPFANSVSGWTIVTGCLVWLARRPVGQSARLGAASFVLLPVGYAVVSDLRGYFFSPVFWSSVGLLSGPLVGGSVAALRRSDRWGAVGGGLLAGVLVGESWNGLTVLLPYTGWVYWTVVGVLGAALLLLPGLLRWRALPLTALAAAVAVAVALLLNGFFALADLGVIEVF